MRIEIVYINDFCLVNLILNFVFYDINCFLYEIFLKSRLCKVLSESEFYGGRFKNSLIIITWFVESLNQDNFVVNNINGGIK